MRIERNVCHGDGGETQLDMPLICETFAYVNAPHHMHERGNATAGHGVDECPWCNGMQTPGVNPNQKLHIGGQTFNAPSGISAGLVLLRITCRPSLPADLCALIVQLVETILGDQTFPSTPDVTACTFWQHAQEPDAKIALSRDKSSFRIGCCNDFPHDPL